MTGGARPGDAMPAGAVAGGAPEESVPDALRRVGVVPVIVIDDAVDVPALAEALLSGGITAAEITLRTPAGSAAIAAAARVDGLLVGAGTVTTLEQVDRAADAGARFIVSPGFDPELVERALSRGLVVLPGVATASEAQAAVRSGLAAVKLFPISQLGGVDFVSALAGPFPMLEFMPSGGVTAANVTGYLEHPAVFAVGGGWIAPRALIAEKRFAEIARNAAHVARLVGSLR
ncbi:bifunctional 4-hydroxy-2-oxoglutarate aldolase/2-dehydro-3-deoxy-phosphogluconate aldolase [Subtercola boreus]|nr:bifunctional 4-hydroxy-2-oxoglutarate aldolase/2-dehydro-3-deoxy-phosphogluconate aldolase [Subtercola boreus]TQL55622.1 2-dehydro-3-deoxyphosphogluconate aldolase/(4S)-4-hydroxy-2-oxoglutarate aldolase [Subtercola boreus]